MIARVVALSITRRGSVLALWGVALIAASVLAARLKLDALPDITNNQVQILTRAPGLTPDEVELRVTRPIEAALGGVPGLAEHRSLSRYGLSAITAVFAEDVDRYRARQLVTERLQVVGGELPAGVDAPELGPMTGGLGEIYHFTVSSPRRTSAELLELVTVRTLPLLRAVEGVVEVNTWGGRQRTLEVHADAVRLAQRGLTLEDLRAALAAATGNAPGAALAAGDAQVLLRAAFLPRGPADLGAAVVRRTDDGGVVRVADVAEVREGSLPRLGAATANARGETVYVMAQMLTGANAREVTGRIRARMALVRAAFPPDVEVAVVYDRATLVNGTLVTVARNLLEGGLLVVGVLLLLLGSLRAGLLVAAAIPISMLGATAAMVLLDIPGNLLSLGALDFGLLVDGAVVLVEHLFHELRPGAHPHPHGPPRAYSDRFRDAAQRVARPVAASVLIILLVYVPVLTLSGTDGKMFRPMAITVVLALVTALLMTLTLLPAAASFVLGEERIPRRDPWLVRLLDRGYAAVLERVHPHPRLVAVAAAALLGVAAGLFAVAGSELAPQLDEGDLVVQTTRAADISLPAAIAQASRMEAALLEAPEVRRVVSRVGSPAVATDTMGLEQADVFVALAPRAAWRPGLTRDALIAELGARIDARTPGSEPAFTQPIQMRFNELLGGSPSDVVVSVYGEELGELRRVAEAVSEAVAAVPGVEDARVLAPAAVSLLEVVPRPLDAARAGLSVGALLDVVQAVRLGVEVGATYDGPLRVPLILRMGDATAFDLGRLAVPAPGGALLPLERLAEITRRETPSLITHDRGQRRLLVGFNVRGADLGTAVDAARERVAGIALPEGVRLEWGGQVAQLADATARLKLVVPAVLLLIFGVLVLTFRRLRHALIILTHVPFACVGGIFLLVVRGMPVSIYAAIGFIALSGIAVMNGVVLLTQVRANELAGLEPARAVLAAARARVRPVLMTALVASLGFVPMALGSGVGAEVQRPLATVVVGGLGSSTVLTLLILPTLYPFLAGRRR